MRKPLLSGSRILRKEGVSVSLANFFAKRSIVRFNQFRLFRVLSRKTYQLISTLYCHLSPQHRHSVALTKQGRVLDTYPYPYSDPHFANWNGTGSLGDYSLVLDQSDSVVKDCTSYCAYKIYETTGKWPKRTSKGLHFDAKDWVKFLREAGYWEIDYEPSKNFYYVGVRTHIFRPCGEVVWFERYEGSSVDSVLISTYDHRIFAPRIVRVPDYVWIKIDRRPTPAPVKNREKFAKRPAFS